MEALTRLGDPAATTGRVILAHLGDGASTAAIRDGKSTDTSMSFTPTSGLAMSTWCSLAGIEFNEARNAKTAGVISTDASRATVRVIRMDKDLMIARSVRGILETKTVKKGLIHEDQHAHS
jgi:acetate kinase